MKKGQLSVEMVLTATLIVAFFTVLFSIASSLRSEAADRDIRFNDQTICHDLASVIDAVYAAGPEAETEYDVNINATVSVGIVEIAGGYYCRIREGAFTGVKTLAPGTHRIKNRRGIVEIT